MFWTSSLIEPPYGVNEEFITNFTPTNWKEEVLLISKSITWEQPSIEEFITPIHDIKNNGNFFYTKARDLQNIIRKDCNKSISIEEAIVLIFFDANYIIECIENPLIFAKIKKLTIAPFVKNIIRVFNQ